MRRRTYEQQSSGHIIDGHEYVDLGLPSGLLWAKCNFGAAKETDIGTRKSRSLSAEWNGWRMPTTYNFDELISNTFNEFTTVGGVKGVKFTSKENQKRYIFIPAVTSTTAYCWTQSVYNYNPSNPYVFAGSDSYIGCSITQSTFQYPHRYIHQKL